MPIPPSESLRRKGRSRCAYMALLSFVAGPLSWVGAQENLMKARDERVALMNEVRRFIYLFVFNI